MKKLQRSDDVHNLSLAKMKRICAWKFVHSFDIGWDISGQNYLGFTVLLIKTAFRRSSSRTWLISTNLQ
jgi:hypothetical protein